MFILTSFTLPLAALTVFSRIGVSCLQGWHHGAQKSTSTGWRLDSSITSLTKPCVVVSLTALSATAVIPPPSCNIFIRLYRRRMIFFRKPGPIHGSSPRTGFSGSCAIRFRLKWVIRRTNAIQSERPPGHPLDPGQMAGGFEEFHQVVAGNRGGHGVDQ